MLNKSKAYIFIIIGIIIYSIILDKPQKKIDELFIDLEFVIRAQSKIDSNIVMLYIDKAVMDSLGRVPLKWNYYTRLIDGLSGFGAKAIGIDNVFDKNSPDYSSQASWLVSAIRNSKQVCIGGYFDKINNAFFTNKTSDSVNSNLSNNIQIEKDSSLIPSGDNFDVSFSWLLKNAAGFGHLNFENEPIIRKVPMVLNNADSNFKLLGVNKIIPAFGLELVRVYLGLSRDSIRINQNDIAIKSDSDEIKIPVEDSQMLINYCKGNNSLKMVSISEFLKLYESKDRPKIAAAAERLFKNKIILISVIGGNTTKFESTPISTKYSSMMIHANIIDTILRQRFLFSIQKWIIELISIIISFIIFSIIRRPKMDFKKAVIISNTLILTYLGFVLILFESNYIFSTQPAILGFIVLVFGSLYRSNILQIDVKKIELEKLRIENILIKSSKKIEHLEKSIKLLSDGNSIANYDLKEYQADLNNLSIRFEDLKTNEKFSAEKKRKLGNDLIYTESSKMEKIAQFVQKISPTNANVLIVGESGTGKELIAKAIHDLSNRKHEKFIVINCGAIPESLLESELFGHEAGSFTDAKKQHKGYFEKADNGTIFLDEITETNELFQVKLLRVLQSGEINRLGGIAHLNVNVRIIAATNKKIEELVAAKKFREDLYYRLNVIKIEVPNLRSRKLDLKVLIQHFLIKENADDVKISNSAMQILNTYNWPGNIRELENVIKRAVILVKVDKNNMIQLKHLSPELVIDFKSKLDMESLIIENIRNKEFSFNAISETANEIGGIHRGTVSEYLKGICFKELYSNNFDIKNTIAAIAGSEDIEIQIKAKIKLSEYLNNLLLKIDFNLPTKEILKNLTNILKKLPVKYHKYVENIIEYYKVNPAKIKVFEKNDIGDFN